MALFRLLIFVGVAWTSFLSAAAKEQPPMGASVHSPDGKFEFYSTPEAVQKDVNGAPYYFGEKLHVRLHGQSEPGLILRENDRWMKVEWAPCSHLLGVEDHWDGHSCNVYVYAISTEIKSGDVQYKLVFQSPHNAYDRIWTFEAWDLKRREIRLRCEGRYQPEGSGGYEFRKSFKIGTRALTEKS